MYDIGKEDVSSATDGKKQGTVGKIQCSCYFVHAVKLMRRCVDEYGENTNANIDRKP